jgi:hypothetical protein
MRPLLTLLSFRGDELGLQVRMPNQIRWGFGGRGAKAPEYVDLENNVEQ